MKAIIPTKITPSMLIASSIPEHEQPAWNEEVEYPVGRVVTHNRQVWESVQAPNMGHVPGSSALYWAAKGASNRWRMFDPFGVTKSVGESPLVITVAPGKRTNSLALRGLRGSEVRVDVRDGPTGPVVYSRTRRLDGSMVRSWYQYFFDPFVAVEELTLTDLPPYRNAHISVTVIGPSSVAVSDVIVGSASILGEAEYGAQAGIISYGRRDKNADGLSRLTRGRFARRSSLRLLVNDADKDRVFRDLTDLRETPCVFQGVDAPGHELLSLFGIYEDFSVDITYPTASYLSIELTGLTEKTELTEA